MFGFTFVSPFALSASTTSGSIAESILSFEIESTYHDSCLGIASTFATDGMTFYSGVYYSHFSTPDSTAAENANIRILCGPSTPSQLLNWAPIKLTVTDYVAITAGSSHYFRFPLIKLPTGNTMPLTYTVKLLQYKNNEGNPTIISQF